jgi:uncharacterized membrane protein YeaQ/YmgE (transglycosylase-associated protein family)
MNIILWIVLGALAGWLAGLIMRSDHSTLGDIILGIVGAFIGGLIFDFFGGTGITGFNLYSLIVAVVGAVILISIGRMFRR